MRFRTSLVLIALLMIGLVGCSAFEDDNNDGNTNNPAENVVIQWPEEPDHILFQADVVGGANADAFTRQGEIPLCTIYGDRRIVWNLETVNDGQILIDVLPDDVIRRFVQDLTIGYALYTYGTGAELLTDAEPPLVETLTLSVNGETHVTDIYGGWDFSYFEEILNTCFSLGRTPTVYQPTGGWLYVQAVEFNPRAPSQNWDAQVTGLDMGELAADSDPLWLEGRLLNILWQLRQLNPPDLQLTQGADTYQFALQIPNVTRNARPAP